MTSGVNPSDELTSRRLALIALVVVAFLWSLNGPLIKLLSVANGECEAVPAVTIACWRSLIGGLPLLPLLIRNRKQVLAAPRGWVVASSVSFLVMALAFVLATTRTAAANAIALQYTSSIWVFVLSPWLLREHPQRGDQLSLAIAVLGVGIIFLGNGVAELQWLLVALLSGLAYGTLTLTLRALRGVSPMAMTALNATLSGVVLLIPALVWGRMDLSVYQWGIVAALGLLQFTAPYVLFAWALQHVPAHHAALIVLAEVGLNPLLTWLVVGEAVPMATRIGGPIILLGVAWQLVRAAHRERRSRRTRITPVGGELAR
jgi:drug/metabolite transporter (DMT)-like permease